MQKSILQSCLGLMVISVLWLGILPPSLAIPIHEVPNPRKLHSGWVTDAADLLTPATEAQLNQAATALEANNGSEIAIVTVPDTQPSQSPKAFATELFNTWGIGKKQANNGVLFLISKADRRVEVEVGRGLQTVLPDRVVTDLLAQTVAPQFRQGNFNQGTIDGVQAILTRLEQLNPESSRVISDRSELVTSDRSNIVGGMFAFCIVSGGALLWVSRRRQQAQPQQAQPPSISTPIATPTPIAMPTPIATPPLAVSAPPPQKNKAQKTKKSRKKKAKKYQGKKSNHKSYHSSSDNSSWDTSQHNSWNANGGNYSRSNDYSPNDYSYSDYSSSSSNSSSDYSSSDYSSSSSSDYSSSDFGGGSSDGGGGGCDW